MRPGQGHVLEPSKQFPEDYIDTEESESIYATKVSQEACNLQINLRHQFQSDFTTSAYTSQSEICDTKEDVTEDSNDEPQYLTMASIMTIIDPKAPNPSESIFILMKIYISQK